MTFEDRHVLDISPREMSVLDEILFLLKNEIRRKSLSEKMTVPTEQPV